MTWNHRVIRKEYKGFNEIEIQFGIHEVYYNDDGVPDMCTENPVDVVGDNIKELKQTLRWMRKALSQPVLDYADFEEGGKYYERTTFGKDVATKPGSKEAIEAGCKCPVLDNAEGFYEIKVEGCPIHWKDVHYTGGNDDEAE